MKIDTTHKRLLVFIALSLFLHLAWFSSQTDYQLYIPTQADNQIAVRVQQQSKRPPVPVTTEPRAKPVSQSKTATHAKSTAQAARQDSEQNQLSSAQVLTAVKQQLNQHFVYPLIARRMGWQGRVLLGFHIDASGSIHRVHIKQSSGYAILDSSAMAALNRIGTVTVKKIEGLIGTWQLEIPIIYRLEG